MISLNKELPKICVNCPCMHTIILQDVACRYCMAEYREIILIPKSEVYAQHWVYFEKPEWCPWIEKEDISK